MSRWMIAGLVALNLMLGAGVYARLGGERSAQAQIGGGRGDYAAVAGNNNGQTILYIMDASTGKMIAIRYDPINKRVEGVNSRNVAADLAGRR